MRMQVIEGGGVGLATRFLLIMRREDRAGRVQKQMQRASASQPMRRGERGSLAVTRGYDEPLRPGCNGDPQSLIPAGSVRHGSEVAWAAAGCAGCALGALGVLGRGCVWVWAWVRMGVGASYVLAMGVRAELDSSLPAARRHTGRSDWAEHEVGGLVRLGAS
jgi:hypothetical protein